MHPLHSLRSHSRALVASLIGTATLASTAVSVTAQTPPALIVQITIDQLRPDYLDRFRSQFTGGFAQLLEKGAFLANAYHDHAVTETAPGHATLWSGRYPSHTGIALNEAGVGDSLYPWLFGRGSGSSPMRFRGSAFFDWLKSKDSSSRALSVSRKDRGAILPVGSSRQQVYWYSLDGRFTTSSYYADTLPTWVEHFNNRDFTAPYLGKQWDLLLNASQYTEPDSIPIENQGRDFVFPHTLPSDRETGTFLFREFPWMDEATVDFALAGVEALELGTGPGTDLLSVSLSTLDGVGHSYGPGSRELHDQLLRTDLALGRLIDSLYSLRDPESIVFVLGSDHGVTPMPELNIPGTDPNRGRVDFRPVFESAWIRMLLAGVSPSALRFDSGVITLDRSALHQRQMNGDSLITALRSSLLRLPGVIRVDRVGELAGMAARGDNIGRKWFQSIPEGSNSELTVTMKEGYYFWETREATHGTVYDLDSRIPVFFMGSMFKPGRYTDSVRSVDIAPTLAAALGVKPTERVDGEVIQSVLRKSQVTR